LKGFTLRVFCSWPVEPFLKTGGKGGTTLLPENTWQDSSPVVCKFLLIWTQPSLQLSQSQLYSLICGVAGMTGKVVYGTVGLPGRICRLHLLPTNTRSVVTDDRASTPDGGRLGYQLLVWSLTEGTRTRPTVKWDNSYLLQLFVSATTLTAFAGGSDHKERWFLLKTQNPCHVLTHLRM
jgi:hypothetical protein